MTRSTIARMRYPTIFLVCNEYAAYNKEMDANHPGQFPVCCLRVWGRVECVWIREERGSVGRRGGRGCTGGRNGSLSGS